ncbi:MAG TPA: hypothetical protein VFI29_09465 [Hanamia sp.]|nr:hypothetical protein [Hanamia sp.]
MRPIKIKKEVLTERDKAFVKLIAIAKAKALSDEELKKLLDEIRSGNEEAIEKLADSYETIILKVAQQIQTEMEIDEIIELGKKSLMKLAENELGSTSRERFFRFSAWYIKQAILRSIFRSGHSTLKDYGENIEVENPKEVLRKDIAFQVYKTTTDADESAYLIKKTYDDLISENLQKNSPYYSSVIFQVVQKYKDDIERLKSASGKNNIAFVSVALGENYINQDLRKEIVKIEVEDFLKNRKAIIDKDFYTLKNGLGKLIALNAQFNKQIKEAIGYINSTLKPFWQNEKENGKIKFYNIEIKCSFWSKLHNLLHPHMVGNPIYIITIYPENGEPFNTDYSTLNFNGVPLNHPLKKQKFGYIMHDLLDLSYLSKWEIIKIEEMNVDLEIKVEMRK